MVVYIDGAKVVPILLTEVSNEASRTVWSMAG